MLKTQDVENAAGSGLEALATARRRRAPRLLIADENGRIVLAAGEPADGAGQPTLSLSLVAELISDLRATNDGEVFALLSANTVVRATPLVGAAGRFYALFFEHVESRDLLANASDRFALSAREIDVLRLVLHGLSTAEIAEQLCIAATTVHAHVKNIARKTKSTKRTEILAKLLGVR